MPVQRLPIIGSVSTPNPAEPVLRAAFNAAGLDVVIERWEPRPHLLGDAISELRSPAVLGALVSSPYKERAATVLTSLSPDARTSGALNAITLEPGRIRGQNTDLDGVRAALFALLPRVLGKWPKTAMVLGAGGAARAVVAVLIGAGFHRVSVLNRHLHKAESLVAYLGRSARNMELRAMPWHSTILESELGRAKLLVNASGIGIEEGGAIPVGEEWLPADLYLLDLVLHAGETPLMQAVKARRGSVANGRLSFLTAQRAAFKLWTGREPPADVMEAALADELGAMEDSGAVIGN